MKLINRTGFFIIGFLLTINSIITALGGIGDGFEVEFILFNTIFISLAFGLIVYEQ